MNIIDHIIELWWKIRWSSRATSLFHFFAMYAPFNSWRIFFYKLRGIKIGKNVYIVQGAFLEESRPWLIEIHENVRIGAGVIIATHDGVYHPYGKSVPYRYGKVVLRKGCTICPGSILLPGITIGESSIVAPGAVVKNDVPSRKIVAGIPAKVIMELDDALSNYMKNSDKYFAIDKSTKYPWRTIG